MKNELIPLLAKLGLVVPIWLHTKNGKTLSILRESCYNKWCYVNNELEVYDITLNPDGTVKGFPYNVLRWEYANGEDI